MNHYFKLYQHYLSKDDTITLELMDVTSVYKIRNKLDKIETFNDFILAVGAKMHSYKLYKNLDLDELSDNIVKLLINTENKVKRNDLLGNILCLPEEFLIPLIKKSTVLNEWFSAAKMLLVLYEKNQNVLLPLLDALFRNMSYEERTEYVEDLKREIRKYRKEGKYSSIDLKDFVRIVDEMFQKY